MTKGPDDLSEGDKVSWKWGQGHPSGVVKDVVADKAEVETKRGNTISKDGTEENPAVVIKTNSGSDGIKRASELDGVNTK